MVVEVLYAYDDFCEDVADDGFGEVGPLFVSIEVEVPLGKILHNYVNVFVVLECLVNVC